MMMMMMMRRVHCFVKKIPHSVTIESSHETDIIHIGRGKEGIFILMSHGVSKLWKAEELQKIVR
jgi:hypothetical protein